MLLLLELLLLLFVLTGYILHKRIINFLSIFNGIWLIIILLYNLKLSYHLNELSIRTITILLWTFSSYGIGYLIIFMFYLPYYKNQIKITPYNVKKEKSIYFTDKFIKNSFYIIIFMLIVETVYSKGFPLFWSLLKSNKTYFDFGIPTLHGILMSYIIFFGTVLYYSIRKNFNKKYLIYFLIIICIPFLLVSRQLIITLIVQLFLLHNFTVKRLNIAKLIPVAVLVILIFGIVGNFRTGLDNFVRVAALKNEDIPYIFSGVYWVYIYLTMTISNLNNLFGFSSFALGYGSNMLDFLLPTVITNYLYNTDSFNKLYFLTDINFTVSGYMPNPYMDFGIYGLVIYTTILGMLGCIIYHRYLIKQDLGSIFIYCVMLQIIVMSFFVDFLLYLPVSFQFVWILLLIKKDR